MSSTHRNGCPASTLLVSKIAMPQTLPWKQVLPTVSSYPSRVGRAWGGQGSLDCERNQLTGKVANERFGPLGTSVPSGSHAVLWWRKPGSQAPTCGLTPVPHHRDPALHHSHMPVMWRCNRNKRPIEQEDDLRRSRTRSSVGLFLRLLIQNWRSRLRSVPKGLSFRSRSEITLWCYHSVQF